MRVAPSIFNELGDMLQQQTNLRMDAHQQRLDVFCVVPLSVNVGASELFVVDAVTDLSSILCLECPVQQPPFF